MFLATLKCTTIGAESRSHLILLTPIIDIKPTCFTLKVNQSPNQILIKNKYNHLLFAYCSLVLEFNID